MASENKTQPTDVSPADYVAALEHKTRKADSEALMVLMHDVTGLEPRMWGPSLVGYGEYHYKYDSGREGNFLMTGFAPRKANMVVYIMPGYRDMSEKLARLGKHKLGKSCLYINKLADVDMAVLREIVEDGYQYMVKTYGSSRS